MLGPLLAAIAALIFILLMLFLAAPHLIRGVYARYHFPRKWPACREQLLAELRPWARWTDD